ncbi:hypothetical protein ACWCPF_25700 [Streptomyces sp. NPDC001858]
MAAYLVVHSEHRREDTLIEDAKITVEFVDGWVLFRDRTVFEDHRVAIAIPAAQVLRVERVDQPQTPQDQHPAPAKE